MAYSGGKQESDVAKFQFDIKRYFFNPLVSQSKITLLHGISTSQDLVLKGLISMYNVFH